ncbi:MAG TPA: hypothetical protein VMW52_03855, partial [Phycisphaerae bacterium]|nr:hypothetical protein [Phycisphaerae bacterium]
MAESNPIAVLSLLAEVLTVTFPEAMGEAYRQYLASFMRHFPLATDSIGNGGRRYDFRTGPTDNTYASGRLSESTQFHRPMSHRTYDSIRVKPLHINSLQTADAVNWADIEFATDAAAAHDIGFDLATGLYEDMNAKRDILMWADRRGKIGGVARDVAVSGDVTEDATADHLTWRLYLDETTIPAAFTKGRRLHICADATPIVALRNYNTPIIVVENIKVDKSVSGAYYSVLVRQSYLAADITNEGSGSGEGRTEVVAEV